MKFINIKSLKKFAIVMLTIIVASCADPDLKPIVTFEDAGHGAYPKLLEESGALLINVLSQADFDASTYGYSVMFIDEAKGKNVASYTLNVEYTAVSGASQGPVELVSYSGADFTSHTTDFQGDFVAMKNVVITASQVAGAFGLVYADLTAGDKFEITGVIVQSNGKIHTGATSSSTVNGAAFQGHFDYTMPAACPSALEGTFSYSTDLSGWCGGTVTGSVDIEALGGGAYTFSDWSFGGYLSCYGCCSASGDFTFVDVCTEVTLNNGSDSYGDGWSFTSQIIGTDDWEITWLNFGYAGGLENGVTTITFPGGVPFTLAP